MNLSLGGRLGAPLEGIDRYFDIRVFLPLHLDSRGILTFFPPSFISVPFRRRKETLDERYIYIQAIMYFRYSDN